MANDDDGGRARAEVWVGSKLSLCSSPLRAGLPPPICLRLAMRDRRNFSQRCSLDAYFLQTEESSSAEIEWVEQVSVLSFAIFLPRRY